MKIEDIENTAPLTQDKVNGNEDHINERQKVKKKSFWKSTTKISILALTMLCVFIIVVIGCWLSLHVTLKNSKGKSQILS